MKRLLQVTLAVWVLAAPIHAAISVVAHNCYALGVTGGTSTALDITGATNLSIGVAAYSAGTIPPTVSDSPGNTLTGRTAQTSSEPWIRAYNVDSPTTSSTYTVTVSGTGGYYAVCIVAWSGGKTSSSFDQEDGGVNNSAAGTSVQAATGFTPANANEILVTFLCFALTNTPTIDSSFGAADTTNYGAGNNEGISMSWQIQTTAMNRQPTWSWSTPTRGVMTVGAYQAAVAGGAVVPKLTLLGVGP